MAKSKKEKVIKPPTLFPFALNGNALRWGNPNYQDPNVEWRPNRVFTAKLQFMEFRHGYRSGVQAYLKDVEDEYEYYMFLSGFENLLKDCEMPIYPGVIWESQWTFCKKGQNFGLKHISPSINKEEVKKK